MRLLGQLSSFFFLRKDFTRTKSTKKHKKDKKHKKHKDTTKQRNKSTKAQISK